MKHTQTHEYDNSDPLHTCAGQPSEDVVDLEVVGGGGAVEDVQRTTQAQTQLPHVHVLAALLIPHRQYVKSNTSFGKGPNKVTALQLTMSIVPHIKTLHVHVLAALLIPHTHCVKSNTSFGKGPNKVTDLQQMTSIVPHLKTPHYQGRRWCRAIALALGSQSYA